MIKRTTTPFSYSAAVSSGDTIYLGLHRGRGESFQNQLRSALMYVKQTLEQHNSSLDHLLKVQVWLKDIDDLPVMEKIFFEFYPKGHFPARMTSTTEFIDRDCLVMIEGVATKETR